jgi:hypothetical protein
MQLLAKTIQTALRGPQRIEGEVQPSVVARRCAEIAKR